MYTETTNTLLSERLSSKFAMSAIFDDSGKSGKPGTETNPFWCVKGSKCPWVNGERGARCGLKHPEVDAEV